MSHLRISFFAFLFLLCAPVYSSESGVLGSTSVKPILSQTLQILTTNKSPIAYRKRTKSTDEVLAEVRRHLDASDAAQAKYHNDEIEKLQEKIKELVLSRRDYEKQTEQKGDKTETK
jgi:cation transport regulator ChaB